MSASSSLASGVQGQPLDSFTDCHSGILSHLQQLDTLPGLLEPAQRARQVAADALEFFRAAVFEHHREEERDLFPAVLASATAGAERDRVQALVQQLTQEHRVVEDLWTALEPGLKQVAKGHDTSLDADQLQRLVHHYQAHARFEETEFLPLSQQILGRNANHMAALGMSLHMRHVKIPSKAYI